MTKQHMPTLTTEQLRTIAREAVADVARQKITTSRNGDRSPHNAQRMSTAESKARAATVATKASKTLNNPNVSSVQKTLAGSALFQAEAKGYFKEAFNKARKG